MQNKGLLMSRDFILVCGPVPLFLHRKRHWQFGTNMQCMVLEIRLYAHILPCSRLHLAHYVDRMRVIFIVFLFKLKTVQYIAIKWILHWCIRMVDTNCWFTMKQFSLKFNCANLLDHLPEPIKSHIAYFWSSIFCLHNVFDDHSPKTVFRIWIRN